MGTESQKNEAGTERLEARGLSRLFIRRPLNFTLRMAPMIDIIFLLLIFFMVCAKWRPAESFLPMRLQTAGAAGIGVVKAEPLIIQIAERDEGCIVMIGRAAEVLIRQEQMEQDLAELIEQLRGVLSIQRRYASDPVEIVCEPGVKWEYFAKIYNVLYGAGLSDITFCLTESP